MKRRTFVLLSLYTGAAASIPPLGCSNGSTVAGKPWVQPGLLSHICDAKTLQEIGAAYREKVRDESNEKQLINLLLADSTNTVMPVSSGDALISSLLAKKTREDFDNGKTVIVKGWVLSETEARQCALFSLTQK
jgi:hypothetical protein